MHDKMQMMGDEESEWPAPSFEETMIIDTIRAMRKDKKDNAKRVSAASNKNWSPK